MRPTDAMVVVQREIIYKEWETPRKEYWKIIPNLNFNLKEKQTFEWIIAPMEKLSEAN